MKIIINRVNAILLITIICALYSCKKSNTLIEKKEPTSFNEVFEGFWDGMNQNYLFWDIDTTNWDVIYLKYRPLFQKLDLKNDDDVRKSVPYFREMTEKLVDGHYNIIFTHKAIQDFNIYPAYARKLKAHNFQSPYNYIKVDTNYLDRGFKFVVDNSSVAGSGVPLQILVGTINDSILFFRCNEFSLFNSYQSTSQNNIRSTLNYFFDFLSTHASQLKGIIIDVRSNSGGNVADLQFLLSPLINKPLYFGYTHYKNGTGRLDYTTWINASVNPSGKNIAIGKPIIALTDRATASLAEIIAMAIQAMPDGFVIGDTTWGATSPLVNEEVYNSGSFEIKNFLTVHSSSCRFKYINGASYEGRGFPPDITVPFDFNALENGKDAVLERSINYIINH